MLSGIFHLCSPGTNGYSFTVSSSTDLIHWAVLYTNVVTDGAVHFLDPDAPDFTTRFYRILPQPAYKPDE